MTVTERSKPQIKPVTERSKPQIKRDDWQRAYTNNFDSVMFHKIDILCTNHLTTTHIRPERPKIVHRPKLSFKKKHRKGPQNSYFKG